jgi:hypothetical protein
MRQYQQKPFKNSAKILKNLGFRQEFTVRLRIHRLRHSAAQEAAFPRRTKKQDDDLGP